MPAAIPAIIGAAGSIGGALIGNHKSASEKDALSGLSDLLNTEVQGGQLGIKQARPLIHGAEGALSGAQGYLAPIVSGGRTAALEAAAPQVNSILSQYDTAKQKVSQFAPRGGGSNATLAEMPFKEAGDITNLLSSTRNSAAQNLASVGAEEGGLASSLLPRDSGAGSSLLNYALGNKQQQGNMWGSIGTSIGTILGGILGGDGNGGSVDQLPLNLEAPDVTGLL